MKNSVKKKAAAFAAAACLLAVSAGSVAGACVSASANSAPAYWYGSDGTGVVPTEENCPVEVERETLTLEIPSLPKASYSSQEEFDEYKARFTAEYTFYNPTEETLLLELAFPFGAAPDYIHNYNADEDRTLFDDSARYGVTVGGENAETALRYTYYDGELTIPAKGKREKGLLKEDTPLYEFSYAASAGVDLYNENYGIEVRLSYSTARTRIFCEHYRDYLLEDGDLVLLLYLNDDPVHFFAVGEKPQVKYTKVVKQDNGFVSGGRTYVEDANIQISENSSTFGTWVGETRPDGVGEVDWYNAFLESLAATRFGLIFSSPAYLSEKALMRWFSYTLEIPAKGRVVNAVTGPLYPDVTHYSYCYTYLLSPAQAWAKFGEFSLTIKTPYTIEECSLSLEKTEDGYTFIRKGLPLGELEFSIREKGGVSGDMEDPRGLILGIFGIAVLAFFAGIAANSIGAVVALIVFFCIRAHRKRKNNMR